jgi:hypothetical protein
MRILLVGILSSFSILCASQDVSLIYSRRISTDSLRENLFVLASDSMQGRETGMPGQKKAAQFIASRYTSYGLLPGGKFFSVASAALIPEPDISHFFFQNHPISVRANKNRNLSVNGESFLFGKDFYYESNCSDTVFFLNTILFVAPGREMKPGPVSERIARYPETPVLMADPGEKRTSEIISALAQRNRLPSLVFLITSPEKIYECLEEKQPGKYDCPVILLTREAASKFFPPGKYEKAMAKADSRKKPYLLSFPSAVSFARLQNTESLTGQNILAFVPGTDRANETLVISSHYDHLGRKDTLLYFGADDNASGTSSVMEMARIFSQARREGHGPRRNILFLNVSGEEKGLLGSAWFVEHPPVPLIDIIADLNIDMVGRTDQFHDSTGMRDYLYIIGEEKLSSELHAVNEATNRAGPNLVLDYKFNNTDDPNKFYRRSDHYNFAKNNIPVIFYFNGTHDDYHKPSDTPDKIDFDLLKKRTTLIFLTAWRLANNDNRPAIDGKADEEK